MGDMTASAPQGNATESLCVFGAREGYTPQIGIFVSQLNWMRRVLLLQLQNLSPEDLDWLPHPKANSIGALLLHLAATDVYYRLNTFDSLPWGHYPDAERIKWGTAMALGETARSRIQGHDLSFYLAQLAETRDKTLLEFKKRDDEWLMSVDETWFWGPTNNLCKWFHVCEHESHHLGQIDLILKQLPSRKDRDPRSLQGGQASRTALGVALRRAAHQIYDSSPLVFADPIAVRLLGDTYAKALADSRASLHQKSSLAMRAWVVARSQFAEEQLERAVSTGVRQYVVLGAGLDTFGLRNPYPEVKVFEVDHPATQMWKRQLVASSQLPEPASLHYVAVDFETQSLREQLQQAGLDLEAPALFAMLGVVVYLTAEAFQETLHFIASFPARSGVIFDYALPRHLLPADEAEARDELAARVASIGEPFRLFFSPEEMRSALDCFDVMEDLDDEELNRRYFRDRTDPLNLHGRSGHIVSAYLGSSYSPETRRAARQ
jgi:methyltransferase (TIGR00027 family)